MADKKNRQVGSVDVAVIKENINNSKNIKNKEARYLFATRLNSLLEEKNITQEILAKTINISTGLMSEFRQGKQEPRLSDLINMAKELNVSIQYLSGESDCKDSNLDLLNKTIGLSEGAMKELQKLKSGSSDEEGYLKILSLLIENNFDMMFILGNIEKYIIEYTKQQLLEQKTKDLSLFEGLKSADAMNSIVAKDNATLLKFKIQESLFRNIDKIIFNYNDYLIARGEQRDFLGGDE